MMKIALLGVFSHGYINNTCFIAKKKKIKQYRSVLGKKVRMTCHPDITAAAKSLQSCPTLCDPREGSPPGSPVPGILQARTLEWVAISFSNA